MDTFLTVSLVLNLGLGVALVAGIKRMRLSNESKMRKMELAHEEQRKLKSEIEFLARSAESLVAQVAETVNEVRDDIDRNYGHVHDNSVLHRLAQETVYAARTGGVLMISDVLKDEIVDTGGHSFLTDDRSMTLGQILGFTWFVHGKARGRAQTLFPVTREECGATDVAAWLSKSLAIYERICDKDRSAAIDSLLNVLTRWREMPLMAAVYLGHP